MSKSIFYFVVLTTFLIPSKGFSECSDQILGLKREIPLDIPSLEFFIRVDTNTRKIFVTGDCTISLDTGKCLTHGETREPYPISGLGLLTVPIPFEGKQGMSFFDQKTFTNTQDSKPIYHDPELLGYYQSFGFLKKNKDEANVRVITYYGFFRDYNIKQGKVSPIGQVKTYCPGNDIKLPMLSKDGKTLSGYSLKNNKTVFFKLADDGKCTPEHQLKFMVGKMDFDYKNKYAAFHVSSLPTGKISDSFQINQQIFIIDVKTKKMHKLSFGSNNIYYPHFGENGLLYALKLDATTKKYSVLEINVDEALKLSNTEGTVCVDCNEEKQNNFFKIGCPN